MILKLKQYYENAFNDGYFNVWNQSPIGIDEDDIRNLSFYRALACYLNNDVQAIADRRELLYSYCEHLYDTTQPDCALKLYRNKLPIKSMTAKILRNVCTAYSTEPRRIFSDTTAIDVRMSEIYTTYNINSILNNIYQQGKYYGIVGIRPIWINEDELKIQVLTPDKFIAIRDKINRSKIIAIIYAEQVNNTIGTDNFIFHYWNDLEYIKFSDNGKELIKEPNQYGRIPFEFLTFGYADNYLYGTMFDAVEAQLHINNIRFERQLLTDFQAFPIMIAVNTGQKARSITPNRAIYMDDLMEDDGKMPPSIDFTSPEPRYLELTELIRNLENEVLRDAGLPLSSIEATGATTSGISRIIERQELIEMRTADISTLRNFEKRLCELIALETLNSLNENLTNLNFSIDYDEERLYLEPDIERASDYERMKQGLIHPVNYINKWSDFDAEINETALIKEINVRKELFKQLFSEPAPEVMKNENVVSENIDENIQIEQDKIKDELQ